ncbi:restriction endonuclease subunit S [Marinobacter sp. HL-58]|uniref:restriction endonuclease subunit S n=1 Tax=Marinobacter sp. HL-58 TaxID=1479237 RepID=UPI00068C89BD|nr:restriction endonuclease subunit S [Marinobacter sp. HL-58]
MGSEWPTSSLGKTCYITDGAHAKVERQKRGVLYLTSKNFGQGQIKLDNADYISQEDFNRLFTDTKKSQRRLRNGDVLTGIIGTFGNAYRYRHDDYFGISSSVAILRPNPDILDSDFLYYVITSETFKRTVAAYKGGSVQGYTNIATLKTLPIPLPDLTSQRQIAALLSGLDEKISLNHQINTTLESMAQALFKSWFVDFDPVIDNALAAGNPIPEELKARADARTALGDQRKPLPDHIRQQFPDRFVLTEEMGWVPEGWEVNPIGSLIELAYGKSLPATKRKEGNVPVYGSGGLSGYHNTHLV